MRATCPMQPILIDMMILITWAEEYILLSSSSRRFMGGMRQCSWLRHYATSWKVAGSITDEAIGFFNRPNPSSRTMAQGSTQPLIETSTRNIPTV
jgi:hypothetical protein